MKAEASTRVTPRATSMSATADSSAGSLGEWMRLTPHAWAVPPSAPTSSSTACATRSRWSPAAPKKPSIPARATSMTSRVVAIPLAIAPVQ